MSEQHFWKERHQDTQNSHTGQFVRTSKSTNVTVQNIQHGK